MKKIIPFLFLLSACAVVVHPTGGDKDENPPEALASFPDSQQVNYKDKEIRIYFDEYFEIKDPNGVLISPPPTKPPKIEVVHKYLRIVFKEPLLDSTTYTVQLINALQDINEKNILPEYTLSFSTGEIIATASINGQVTANYTRQKAEGYTVALFHPNITDYPDSVVYPLYLSKTSTQGTFTIPSIKSQAYTLYAFNDINHNKRIDIGEDMGYLPDPVNPYDTVEVFVAKNALDPPLVTYTPIPLDIRSFLLPFRAPEGGVVKILTSQTSFDRSQILYSNSIHKDTIQIVDFIKTDIDSVLNYYVTLNDRPNDTIKVTFPHKKPEYSLTLQKNQSLVPGQAIEFSSNQVIRDVRKEHTQLFIHDTIPITDYTLSSTPFSIILNYSFAEKERYTFIFNPAAIHYYDASFSQADTVEFRMSDKNSYGDVAILFSNADKLPLEVQLLKELKDEVLFRKETRSDSVYFSNIPAGEYSIRLVYSDSISKPNQVIPFRRMPSRVYVHPGKLVIRGGWIIGDFLLNNEEN